MVTEVVARAKPPGSPRVMLTQYVPGVWKMRVKLILQPSPEGDASSQRILLISLQVESGTTVQATEGTLRKERMMCITCLRVIQTWSVGLLNAFDVLLNSRAAGLLFTADYNHFLWCSEIFGVSRIYIFICQLYKDTTYLTIYRIKKYIRWKKKIYIIYYYIILLLLYLYYLYVSSWRKLN